MGFQTIAATILRPYMRAELPGWGKVLHWTGIGKNYLWANAGFTFMHGKNHGYLMKLNLADRDDRMTYFLGRFQELETELVVKSLLHPGDSVVDIGANRGMFALTCARLAAPGKVLAFEPNPYEAARIEEIIDLNGIINITVHKCALADTESIMKLHLLDDLSGLSTLADVRSGEGHRLTGQIDVQVKRGDVIIGNQLSDRTLIKIDVQGFEIRVLRGLADSIRKYRPAIYAEVESNWLKRAGASVEELLKLISEQSYRIYFPFPRRQGLKMGLAMKPVESADQLERFSRELAATCRNILCIHPQSIFVERLQNAARVRSLVMQ